MEGWVSGQSWDSGWAGPGDKGLHPFVLLSSYQGPQLQLDSCIARHPHTLWTPLFQVWPITSAVRGSERPLVAQVVLKPEAQEGLALWGRQELGLPPPPLPSTPSLGSAPQTGLDLTPIHVSLYQALCFSVFIHFHWLPVLVPVSAHLGLCPSLSRFSFQMGSPSRQAEETKQKSGDLKRTLGSKKRC